MLAGTAKVVQSRNAPTTLIARASAGVAPGPLADSFSHDRRPHEVTRKCPALTPTIVHPQRRSAPGSVA